MENIRLTGSPAALIAADDAEDDGDEAAPAVRLHAEAANDGADDDDDPSPKPFPRKTSYYGANYCARLPGTGLCFPGKSATLTYQISTV